MHKTSFISSDSRVTILLLVAILLLASGCTYYKPENLITATNDPIPDDQLRIRFYGTSTLLLSNNKNGVLIDGFFTRQGVCKSIFDRMEPDPAAIKVIEDEIVDAVFVAHSHFDHARDSGMVANDKDAILYGSDRTLEISEACEEKSIDAKEVFSFGDIHVEVIWGMHGHKSSLKKAVEKLFLFVAGGTRFSEEGGAYNFYVTHGDTKVLIVPSAHFPPNWAEPKGKQADIVFLSLGLLGDQEEEEIEKYWDSAVVKTCARWVVPIHWDDFRKPLGDGLIATKDVLNDVTAAMEKIKKLADTPNCGERKAEVLFPRAKHPIFIKKKRAATPQLLQVVPTKEIDKAK